MSEILTPVLFIKCNLNRVVLVNLPLYSSLQEKWIPFELKPCKTLQDEKRKRKSVLREAYLYGTKMATSNTSQLFCLQLPMQEKQGGSLPPFAMFYLKKTASEA